jgi:hypothetical protein
VLVIFHNVRQNFVEMDDVVKKLQGKVNNVNHMMCHFTTPKCTPPFLKQCMMYHLITQNDNLASLNKLLINLKPSRSSHK